MTEWSAMVDKVLNLKKTTKIALVGKYVSFTMLLVKNAEALKTPWQMLSDIDWVNANDLIENVLLLVCRC